MQSRVSKGRKTVCFRGSTSGGFVVGGVAGSSMLANCEAMLMEFKCERVRVEKLANRCNEGSVRG